MNKQYIISVKSNLSAAERTAIIQSLIGLNVKIVSQLDQLNTITVKVPNENMVGRIKQIKGVSGVEEDSTMNIL